MESLACELTIRANVERDRPIAHLAPTRKSVGFKSMIRNLSLPQCSLHTSYGLDTQVRLWFTTQTCLLRGGNGDRTHARSRLDPLWNSRLSTSTDKWRTTDVTNCGR